MLGVEAMTDLGAGLGLIIRFLASLGTLGKGSTKRPDSRARTQQRNGGRMASPAAFAIPVRRCRTECDKPIRRAVRADLAFHSRHIARRGDRSGTLSVTRGFARRSDILAAGRDGLLARTNSADSGGWPAPLLSIGGCGTADCNNAVRDHNADRSRTPPDSCGKFAGGEQPRYERHPRCQVGLDNGDQSWQGWTIFQDGYLMKVAKRGPAVRATRPPSSSHLRG